MRPLPVIPAALRVPVSRWLSAYLAASSFRFLSSFRSSSFAFLIAANARRRSAFTWRILARISGFALKRPTSGVTLHARSWKRAENLLIHVTLEICKILTSNYLQISIGITRG